MRMARTGHGVNPCLPADACAPRGRPYRARRAIRHPASEANLFLRCPTGRRWAPKAVREPRAALHPGVRKLPARRLVARNAGRRPPLRPECCAASPPVAASGPEEAGRPALRAQRPGGRWARPGGGGRRPRRMRSGWGGGNGSGLARRRRLGALRSGRAAGAPGALRGMPRRPARPLRRCRRRPSCAGGWGGGRRRLPKGKHR